MMEEYSQSVPGSARDPCWEKQFGENYYYGVYFGVHETRACVLQYADVFLRSNLSFPWPGNSRKFKFTLPKNAGANAAELTATAYFNAIRNLIEEKVVENEYIDGITVSFAFLPLNLVPDTLQAKLTEYVAHHTRPPMNDKTVNKPGVFVREEFRIWDRLVVNLVDRKNERKIKKENQQEDPVKLTSNFAVLYCSNHYFYFHKGHAVRGTGIPGEVGTIEPIGLRALEHLHQVRNREDDDELESNEVYRRAKELFGATEFDELMDKIRGHYDVLKITQLADLLTDPQFEKDYETAGYNILTDFWIHLEDKLNQTEEPIHIVLVGLLYSSMFEHFAKMFAKVSHEKFKRLVFHKCTHEMMNDPEVTAAFLAIQTIKGKKLELVQLTEPALLAIVPPSPRFAPMLSPRNPPVVTSNRVVPLAPPSPRAGSSPSAP